MADCRQARDPFCFIITCRDFPIFNMAAVRHVGFLELKFLTAVYFSNIIITVVYSHKNKNTRDIEVVI